MAVDPIQCWRIRTRRLATAKWPSCDAVSLWLWHVADRFNIHSNLLGRSEAFRTCQGSYFACQAVYNRSVAVALHRGCDVVLINAPALDQGDRHYTKNRCNEVVENEEDIELSIYSAF